MECNYIFVKTPTIEELKLRLQKRATETQDSLDSRIRNAETEIEMAERMGIFQNTFINDDKEKFLEESTKYIIRDLYGLDR